MGLRRAFVRHAAAFGVWCWLVCAVAPAALAAEGDPRTEAADLFRLGLGVYRELSAKDGTAIFARAVELDPDTPLYAIYLADALYRAGKRIEANEAASRVAELTGDEDMACFFKGKRAQLRGELDDAVFNFRESLMHKASPHVFFELAALEIAQGDLKSAEVDVRIGLQRFPNDYFLHDLRGTILHEQGRYGDAIEAFTEAIRNNSALPNARINRALAYLAAGDTDKALKDCEAVLSVYPDRERAKYVMASVLEKMKRYGAAREIIDTLAEAHPDDAGLWLVQGWLYYKTDKAREAEKILGKYVAEMPDDPEGHYKLATLYAGRRKSRSAFMKLRRALELNYAQTLEWIRGDMEWDRYRDTRKFKALLDDTAPAQR